MEPGRSSRYIIYALGEILLVMIGILLALQVNNWNQERLNRITEKRLLSELREDFLLNKEIINKQLHILKQTLIEPKQVRARLAQGQSDSLIFDHMYNMKVVSLDLVNGSILDILNSNQLVLIQDHKLRRMISSWHSSIEDALAADQKHLHFRQTQLVPYMINCCPQVSNLALDRSALSADYKFDNLLLVYTNILDLHILKYEEVKKYIEDLLGLIQQELEI